MKTTNRKGKEMKMLRSAVAGLFVLFCATWATAAPADLGMFCWRMAPFDDTLEANVTQTDGGLLVFSLEAAWNGMDVYTLEGGATAVIALTGSPAAVTGTLYNPTTFWGGHSMCQLSMGIMLPDLDGVWGMSCGNGSAAVFRQGGTLEVIDCMESTSALIASSKAEMVDRKMNLAGVQSQ